MGDAFTFRSDYLDAIQIFIGVDMTGNTFSSLHPPATFSPDRFDSAECRRLRLALGLNAEKMALLAGMPGRWAWLSVENGYEPIDRRRWAICLAELDNHSGSGISGVPTPRYEFEVLSRPENARW